MKEVVFATPNRMQLDSGHREFDRAIGALRPGNSIDGGYHSSHIRPFNTPTLPDGRTPCQPGAMQDFDLQSFRDAPELVLQFVRERAVYNDVILYEIRHTTSRRDSWGERIKIRHGYIVARGADDDYRLLKKFYCGATKKSIRVVDVCAEYVSNPEPRPDGELNVGNGPRARLSLLAECTA